MKVEKVGERDVKFTFDAPGNRELPQIVGQLTVLPKHWWEGTDAGGRKRDVSNTSLEKPLGSGPYRIKDFVAGRSVTLERVNDYWGRDLDVSIGRNNFDELRYDYFRDARWRWKRSRPIRSTGARKTAPKTGPRPTTFRPSAKSVCCSRNSPIEAPASCRHSA